MKKNKLLIGTAIACVALAVLVWFAFSQQSSSALTFSPESRQQSGAKMIESQNILNLSPSEKERLSQQQIVFNEIEKDQLHSKANFPLLKNAKGMVIKYDPNVIELKKVGDTVKFQMLEYGINRTGKIVEIEPVDQDIVRWTGRFDQGDPNQNFFTITQSQKVSGWYKLWMRVLRIKNYIMIIHKGINDFGREKKLVRSLSVRI